MSLRVVIVGGGVHGSALAWWLTRQTDVAVAVTVVERDPTYREASSARSASSLRQQFSQPVNVEIGLFGRDFLRRAGELLKTAGERPEVGFVERGYLYLATEAGAAVMRESHRLQRALGADVALLDPAELKRRWPFLATDGVALASHGSSGEGWFDGWTLLRAFRRAAIAQGACYVEGEAVAAELRGDRVTTVVLASGERLACDVHVNAAGPWSAGIAAQLGGELPVRARRRSVFVLEAPCELPGCPLLIDTSGLWFRPESRGFITGASPHDGEDDPDDLPLEPDHALFEDRIWPGLAARIPVLERLRVTSAWAGYYEHNTVDQNGLVGRMPGLANAYVAAGFSGHGIQQAPAVGRGLAELILHQRYLSLDLSPLDPARIPAGRPLLERNVI